jgi:hypothetical protein
MLIISDKKARSITAGNIYQKLLALSLGLSSLTNRSNRQNNPAVKLVQYVGNAGVYG